MECNKEEAIRAKVIAEKKMQTRDFVCAKKLLLKALHLFPDIENASHMLTVCEVHCSAESLINGQTDHYGVLQVESSVDEALIRKHYRRLALLLHPDKNKFAGAEGAFKLVGEAYKVLSDQASRQVYDSKRRVQMKIMSPWNPSQHVKNTNYFSDYQSGAIKHQSSEFFVSPYFWSLCVYCNNLLPYSRALLNREVQCQKCLKKVFAFEVVLQIPPPGSSSGFPWRHAGFHQTDVSSVQYFHNHGSQAPFPNPSGSMACENVNGNPSVSKPSKSVTATKHGPCSTNMEERDESGEGGMVGNKANSQNSKPGGKSAKMPSSHCVSQISGRASVNSNHSNSPRRGSTDNDNIMEASPTNLEDGPTIGRYPRRSTRCKVNVSYKEDEIEDNFLCTPKRSRNVGSYRTKNRDITSPEVLTSCVKMKTKEIPTSEKEILWEQIRADHIDDNLPENKEAVYKKNNKRVRAGSNANSAANLKSRAQVDFSFSYPDPEFYNFEMDRHQSKFSVNQIWAVYDDDDGMPRYYALIQKVFYPGFKLQYTWLEYNPMSSAEQAWVKAGLPTACGSFKLGKVCSTKCQLMFSHLISGENGRGSIYNIYPKKGEVWALFNDWDMQWSSREECHRKFSYEFVEVVSDYASGEDFIVNHLVKVKGFLYLFARAQDKESTVVTSGQLLKFSHCLPHCRISVEREGIPRDSFELDPAAFPESVVNITDAGGAHTTEVLDVKSSDLCPGPEVHEDKLEGDVINQHVLKAARSQTRYDAFDNSDKNIESSNGQESADLEFYNFQKDRLEQKFNRGQIWGLYSDIDEYPNYYAWVSSAGWETTGLNVKWLEFSPQTEEENLWSKNDLPVSCGRFKVSSKVAQYDSTHAFSHLVCAKSLRKNNLFEIYPNVGDVWAVFSKWSLKWTSTDFDKVADYSVVEVVERDTCVIKVMTLTKVDGYKYVFMPKTRSVADMEIPSDECLRFSHQIPAFRLIDQESGKLKDCWELDPDSIPKILLTM